jgi:hypothetical protein
MPAGAAAMREPTCERILSYHARTQVQLSATRRRRRKKRLTMTSSGVDAFQNRPLPALTAAQRYHLDVFGYVVVRTSSSYAHC